MNNTGTPYGEKLGRINPLSNSSCNFAFSSFNSAGAILYGACDIGAVPGVSSILNSISYSGGNPGKSSGNTSSNPCTTGNSFNFVPSFLSCTTEVR